MGDNPKYENETKATLMKRLDTRNIPYKKKDTKPTLIEKLQASDKDHGAIADRLAKTAAGWREKANSIRSMLTSHREPSSRVSAKEISKFWDKEMSPEKARERAIKLAKRRRAEKIAKKSRQANR